MITNQLWFLKRNTRLLQIAIPLIAGCVMLCTSLLPWLHYPLGLTCSAWQLPVDIGWQFRSPFINYGLLCLCCALCAFAIAFAHMRPFPGSRFFAAKYTTVGIICMVPLVLFVMQYLFFDIGSMSLLARQKIQMLLLEKHLGYGVGVDRISLKPFQIDIATLKSRFLLLFDQVQIGAVLSAISAWLLIDARRFIAQAPKMRHPVSRRQSVFSFVLVVMLCLVFGRGCAATLCDDEARTLLSTGNYAQALTWLSVADALNPALEQAAFYHIERGKALYYLSPHQGGDDVHIYLAWAYRGEGDYLDAYQELLAVTRRTAPWAVSEMDITLAELSEAPHPLAVSLLHASDNDDSALPWLQDLNQLDAANVYALYMNGRIQYDLHNYSTCLMVMNEVAHLSVDADVLSSAYTYMGLSYDGLGKYDTARELLFHAIQLDPHYHNNTAREELSGLR